MAEESSYPFEILEATPDDAEAIYKCSNEAMGSSFYRRMIFPPEKAHLTSDEDLTAWRVGRTRKMMDKGELIYFKAVQKSDQQQVAGYAGWYKPNHFKEETSSNKGQPNIKGHTSTDPALDRAASSAESSPPVGNEQQNEDFPACMNVEAHKYADALMDEERKKIWSEDANYWYLGALGVDPAFQRQGIAARLLKVGLDRADSDGVPIYLEATPDGALMYPKFGFEKVGELSMFDGQYVIESHVRPARTAQS